MKVLIVGCGSIGRRHMRNLRSLRPDVELIAYRTSERDSGALRSEFGLQEFRDLGAALKQGPQAAIIANPSSLHVQTAVQAADRGCHLLIEKPLSDSLEGIESLVDAVRRNNLIALMGFNLRYHPVVREARRVLGTGEIGKVHSIRAQVGQYLPDWHPGEDYRLGYSARRELGGGAILDLIHELDYVRWLFGEVSAVACFATRASDLEIDTEDLAEIILQFASGAIGNVHVDYLQRPPSRSCVIVGSGGTLACDLLGNELSLFQPGNAEPRRSSFPGYQRNEMFLEEMSHFLACVEGTSHAGATLDDGTSHAGATLDDGIATLRLALAAHESARSMTTVATA